MTRAPWVLPKPDRAFPARDVTAVSTTLGWRLVNPAMPKEWTVSLGECNELLQEKFAVSRERQDAFAVRSHRLAAAAWDEGFYDDLVLPVGGLTRDEGIRPDSSPEKLAALKPSFRPDGTITAGNASRSATARPPCSSAPRRRRPDRPRTARPDRRTRGARRRAAGVRVRARRGGREGTAAGRDRLGRRRRRRTQRGVRGTVARLRGRLGRRPGDRQHARRRHRARPPARRLRRRLLGTLAKVLRERRQRWGVAAICIGVGQALAVVLENVTDEVSQG